MVTLYELNNFFIGEFMKMKAMLLISTIVLFAGYVHADDDSRKSDKTQPNTANYNTGNAENAFVQQFLTNIFQYNKNYSTSYNSKDKENYLKKQTPMVTLVTCSDSRVSSESFGETDINNIFVVRNIGNQLDTAEGSIEYGVRHLHTKILIFIGHTECGAVDASLTDMKGLSKDLKKELLTLRTSKAHSLDDNIIANIDHQVAKAYKKFKNLVEKDDLLILGILYDLHDHLGGGNHRIYITNVNGIKDEKIIASDHWIKDVPDIKILANKYHKLD